MVWVIRVDRHTMANIVASYPLTHFQVARRPDGPERLAEWEAATVEWIRARWGDQVRTVFAHDDEDPPHIRAWLLPDDPDAQATTLYPGKVAKAAEQVRMEAQGVPKKEAVRLGDKALREAMAAFLDSYWQDVGIACGMTRNGPKQARLTRPEALALARKAEVERMTLAHRAAKEEVDVVLELRATAVKAAQVQADRQALDQKKALAAVTKQIEDGAALAVDLVDDERLRRAARGVDVPPMMSLRDWWARGIARVRDLLRLNRVSPELRDDARQIVGDEPR